MILIKTVERSPSPWHPRFPAKECSQNDKVLCAWLHTGNPLQVERRHYGGRVVTVRQAKGMAKLVQKNLIIVDRIC